MFVHTVYFWLKPDLTADQRKSFADQLKTLLHIASIEHGWVGQPADTDRPVIDRSYTWALTTVFKDRSGHDIYQVDPIHKQFVADCSPLWEKVVIYDAVE